MWVSFPYSTSRPSYFLFICLLILWGAFYPLKSSSQKITSQPALHYYSVKNGLANNVVNATLQDNRGFLWIATGDGLNRFDGTEFTAYYHKRNNARSLPANNISDLALLPGNRIVIATTGGLCIMNTINLQIKRFNSLINNSQYSSASRFSFVKYDRFHHLWAASESALYLLNDTMGVIRDWTLPLKGSSQKMPGYIKYFLYPDSIPGILNNRTVYRFRPSSKELLLDTALTEKLADDPPTTFLCGNKNGLWWVKQGADSLYHQDNNGKFHYYTFPPFVGKEPLFTFLSCGGDSILWCGNSDGYLLAFNMVRHRFKKQYLFFTSAPVIGDWIFTADMDYGKVGNIWISTMRGLYKFNPKIQANLSFDTSFYFKNAAIKTAAINAVLPVGSGYWVGTYGSGLFWVDPAKNLTRQFDLGSWLRNWVWSIRRQSKDTLWIGTQDGLIWFNQLNNHYGQVHGRGLPLALDSFTVTTQFVDSHRDLWMGISNSRGLVRYNLDTHALHYYKKQLPLPLINCITEDSSGNLWMGSLAGGGLVYWDRGKDKFSLLPARTNSNFEQDKIFTIHADDFGNVWFNAGKSGLERYNIASHTFTNYSRDQGICSDVINSIFGKGKDLWIATANGISRFNIITGHFKNYRVPIEDPDGPFDFVSVEDSIVFIGGPLKLQIIKDKTGLESSVFPRIYITALTIDGQSTPLGQDSPLKLKFDQNYLRISYTAINFEDEAENHYFYKLEGTNGSWIAAGESRVASYAGLAPGKYTFHVRASNNDHLFSPKEATIAFIIAPPFWQQIWFRILIVGLILLILVGLYKYRLRQIMRVQQVRNRIAADLHDDLGASLSNIAIQSSMAIGAETPNSKTQSEVKSLFVSIREDALRMSDAMDDIVWFVNPRNDSLDIVLSRMRLYASKAFEAGNIQYDIQFPENAQKIKLSMTRRHDLFLIFKEAVNNITKHAQCTSAQIRLQLQKNVLILEISDNGKGFEKAAGSNRNGLVNMQQRAKNCKGELKITTTPAAGTFIVLRMKLDK